MDTEDLMLMRELKPYDRWVLENRYDGPIPIEVIKNKIASYGSKGDEFDEVDVDGRGIQSFGLRRSILKNN